MDLSAGDTEHVSSFVYLNYSPAGAGILLLMHHDPPWSAISNLDLSSRSRSLGLLTRVEPFVNLDPCVVASCHKLLTSVAAVKKPGSSSLFRFDLFSRFRIVPTVSLLIPSVR